MEKKYCCFKVPTFNSSALLKPELSCASFKVSMAKVPQVKSPEHSAIVTAA